MASKQEILDAATALGNLIAKHDAAVKYTDVVNKLQKDVEAQRLLTDYQRHLVKMSEKESQGQPIEVEDKHRMESLHNQIIHNPILRDLQITQMDYLDLMRQVNNAITGHTGQQGLDPGLAGGLAPGQPGAAPAQPHENPLPPQ